MLKMKVRKASGELRRLRWRAKVKHPLRVIKRQFGYVRGSFCGLVKNTGKLMTLFALSNLWVACRHLLTNTGELRL